MDSRFDDEEFKEDLRKRNINPDDPESGGEDLSDIYLNLLNILKEKSDILNSAINSSICSYLKLPEESPLKKEFENYIKSLMPLFLNNAKEFDSLLHDLN